MHYRAEKRLRKVFLPFLLALVRPHLESCVVSGLPSTRNTWTCWSVSQRCLGAGAQEVGEEKELACSALKSKGQRRLNHCLQLTMGVLTEGMGVDLAVHSERARGHAAAQVNPSSLSSGTSYPEGLSSLHPCKMSNLYWPNPDCFLIPALNLCWTLGLIVSCSSPKEHAKHLLTIIFLAKLLLAWIVSSLWSFSARSTSFIFSTSAVLNWFSLGFFLTPCSSVCTCWYPKLDIGCWL